MPRGLKRYQQTRQSHFVTFCCYHRRPFLTTDASRRTFEAALERVRHAFKLRVFAYVIMPEHVHLLLSEPQLQDGRDGQPNPGGPLNPRGPLSLGGPLKPAFGLSGDPKQNPKHYTLADALKSLKQGVSRRLIGDAEHFWQKRYYDFNIRRVDGWPTQARLWLEWGFRHSPDVHSSQTCTGICQ